MVRGRARQDVTHGGCVRSGLGPDEPAIVRRRGVAFVHPRGVTALQEPTATLRAMATTTTKPLSDAELVDLLALIGEADSVELKLTVPDTDQHGMAAKLGMDPLDAQIRQVFFFDTPDLQLDRAGIAVRARRVQGRGDDSTVKLRPCVPSDLPKRIRRSPNVVVEVDAMPGGYVCSASMKHAMGATAVRAVVNGEQPTRKLFSKEQRAMFESYAPVGLALDDLTILGPIFVLKLKAVPRELGRKLVAELWQYPDFSRVLELSTRTTPGEAFQVRAEGRAYLTQRGVPIGGDQQTKTRAALTFFSNRASAAT